MPSSGPWGICTQTGTHTYSEINSFKDLQIPTGFLAPEEMLYAPSLGPDGGGWAEAQSCDPASVLEDPQSLPVPHTETPLGAALLCLFCSFAHCS